MTEESNQIMTSYYDSKVHLGVRKPSFTSTMNLMDKVQSHDTMKVQQSMQTECIGVFSDVKNLHSSNKQFFAKPQSIGKV